MQKSAADLRAIISELIKPSIGIRRRHVSAKYLPENLLDPEPSEDEISDFIVSNELFDLELIGHLVDPGLLGFHNSYANFPEDWFSTFKWRIESWTFSEPWLNGVPPIWPDSRSVQMDLWTPAHDLIVPSWVHSSPTYFLLAKRLVEAGSSLENLRWQDFEKLIGYLLEKEGWDVQVTQLTKDGGMDIIASKEMDNIGLIKTVWQAKKYKHNNLVRLNQVRELYAILEESRASKAIIATTSRLSKDAIEWIRKDEFRFSYRDGKDLNEWIKGLLK